MSDDTNEIIRFFNYSGLYGYYENNILQRNKYTAVCEYKKHITNDLLNMFSTRLHQNQLMLALDGVFATDLKKQIAEEYTNLLEHYKQDICALSDGILIDVRNHGRGFLYLQFFIPPKEEVKYDWHYSE
jgi:uncharacterized protein YbgA (DUF1722 family)